MRELPPSGILRHDGTAWRVDAGPWSVLPGAFDLVLLGDPDGKFEELLEGYRLRGLATVYFATEGSEIYLAPR